MVVQSFFFKIITITVYAAKVFSVRKNGGFTAAELESIIIFACGRWRDFAYGILYGACAAALARFKVSFV